MDINKDQLDKLTMMSDMDFKSTLENALSAAGADSNLTSRLGENIPQIKKVLASLSEQDIQALSQKLDPATLNAIKDTLNK